MKRQEILCKKEVFLQRIFYESYPDLQKSHETKTISNDLTFILHDSQQTVK